MFRLPVARISLLTAALVLFLASPAHAQWYGGVFFGANRTEPATVSIDSVGLVEQFHDVHFDGKSFDAPLYYGGRVGRGLWHRNSFTIGLEGEYIHAKVYADTTRTYVVTPGVNGAPSTSFAAMNATVQRYNMSHGLNLLLANVVLQAPLTKSADSRTSLAIRAGFGPTIPHAESTVLGEVREQYEYGGMAFGAGAGIDARVAGPVSAFFDYRVTVATPEITLAHGTGHTTALMHHLLAGVTFRLTK